MSLKKGTSLEQRQMNKRLIIKFLEEYRNNPCLWNIKCKEYNDRKLKKIGYDKLVNLLKPSIPEVDKNYIVKKINTLRSCFRKEYKKVLDSLEKSSLEENLYKPSLWYYDLLLFTMVDEKYQPAEQKTKSEKTELFFNLSEDEECTVIEINSNQKDDTVSQNEEEEQNKNHICVEIPENKLNYINKNNKRLKIESENNNNSTITKYNSTTKSNLLSLSTTNGELNHQDEFDAFGFLVASKLRKISSKSENQQLFCENIINQALMKGLLCKLTEDSLIEC